MWRIARALTSIARSLIVLAVELAEHERRSRIMTDAISELEGAQADRDQADSDLSDAIAAELDRVETDVKHLLDEINSGAGNTDPTRLARVTQGILAGTARVRALTEKVNAEDPVPDEEPPVPAHVQSEGDAQLDA
jgi:hypothetical protein